MCTLVLLRRPGHEWPLLLAANRDERTDRPWLPPARHWPDRPGITAGRDDAAGGSWLGVNDAGVVATVMNRVGSTGPESGRRSRGELVLAALEAASAAHATRVLAGLDPQAYLPFNLVVADRRQAFWLRHRGAEGEGVVVTALPEGLSMITAYDANDFSSARIRAYLPRFRAAPVPDPGADDWSAWEGLLASRGFDPGDGPLAAMTIVTDRDFATVSGSLIALPASAGRPPRWRFAAGPPGQAAFVAVPLAPHGGS